MARTRNRRRSHAQSARKAALKAANDFEALAILLLSEAEDEEDELNALLVGHLAFKMTCDARRMPENGRFGIRGPYNRDKATDFFDLLLGRFTDREFKAWLR